MSERDFVFVAALVMGLVFGWTARNSDLRDRLRRERIARDHESRSSRKRIAELEVGLAQALDLIDQEQPLVEHLQSLLKS